MGKGWRRVGKAQLTCRIAVEVEAEAREWTERTGLVERDERKKKAVPSAQVAGAPVWLLCAVSESFQGRMMVRDSFPSM